MDLIFRLVMFFNSLPSYSPKQSPILSLRSFERQKFCSPQLFKLMMVLKMADYRSRNMFASSQSIARNKAALKTIYSKLAAIWQQWNRRTSS